MADTAAASRAATLPPAGAPISAIAKIAALVTKPRNKTILPITLLPPRSSELRNKIPKRGRNRCAAAPIAIRGLLLGPTPDYRLVHQRHSGRPLCAATETAGRRRNLPRLT